MSLRRNNIIFSIIILLIIGIVLVFGPAITGHTGSDLVQISAVGAVCTGSPNPCGYYNDPVCEVYGCIFVGIVAGCSGDAFACNMYDDKVLCTNAGCDWGETSCADGIDNDGDGKTDCADSDCAGSSGPQGQTCEPSGETICNDGKDNDADALIDCKDNSCNNRNSCEYGSEVTCSDDFDNDGDGKKDCIDTGDCLGEVCGTLTCPAGSSGSCAQTCTIINQLPICDTCISTIVCKETTCNDAKDNDEDGKTDCKDPDCDKVGICEFNIELTCNDNKDNDGDSLIDSNDPDCGAETICNDGIDNDGDGATDCADDDCDGLACATKACPSGSTGDGCERVCDYLNPSDYWCESSCDLTGKCTETNCEDEVDNDKDGKTDSDDADCVTEPVAEDCDNGIDDDGDGLTDCDDSECTGDPNCVEEPVTESNCNDGIDNDGDGYADCDDSDCVNDPACVEGEPVCTSGDRRDCGTGACAGSQLCSAEGIWLPCDGADSTNEICDGIDNDCDDSIDEDFDLTTDANNCGACGNVCANLPNVASVTCEIGKCVISSCTSTYYNINLESTDGCEYNCEITNNGEEIVDGKDNDCDGSLLKAEQNLDGDLFTVAEGDCDDSNGGVYPGAIEYCDGIDNNCDGVIDEGCEGTGDNIYRETTGSGSSRGSTSSPAPSTPTKNPLTPAYKPVAKPSLPTALEVGPEVPSFPVTLILATITMIILIAGLAYYFYYLRPPESGGMDYTRTPRFTESYPGE